MINMRKCKFEVQCEGEEFMVDALQCPTGAQKLGGEKCRDCDGTGYADCLTMGLNPQGDVGVYAPEVHCQQPKGQFTPWPVQNRGPIVCGLRQDRVDSEHGPAGIRSLCEQNPQCWGYSVITDVLYSETPKKRYSWCTCDAASMFQTGGLYDEVKTLLRVSVDLGDELGFYMEDSS